MKTKGRAKWLIACRSVPDTFPAALFCSPQRSLHANPLRHCEVFNSGRFSSLLGMNTLIYFLVSARWWFIVHAENNNIRYCPLIGVRISVFGISYFTLGPQVGGEPLQILYLQRNYGLTYTRATASVVMDKLLEFLANFFLLVFGLTAVLRAGILSTGTGLPLPGLARSSASSAMASGSHRPALQPALSLINFVAYLAGRPPATESSFASRAPANIWPDNFASVIRALYLAAILVSLLASAGTVSEYALITSFLNIGLPFWQTCRGLDSRLAFFSHAVARRFGRVGGQPGICIGFLWHFCSFRPQCHLSDARPATYLSAGWDFYWQGTQPVGTEIRTEYFMHVIIDVEQYPDTNSGVIKTKFKGRES